MNAISELDNGIHKRPDIALHGVWEGNIQTHGPSDMDGDEVKPCENAPTFGRAEGHRWGYQVRGRWLPKRFDKLLYTGDLEVVVLKDIKDSSGKVGRLGVGCQV